MNTEDIEELLRAGRLPEQAFPLHARRLKSRLLAERRARAASRRPGSILTSMMHMTRNKTIAFAGVTAAVFAFVLFGSGHFGTQPTPYAQAQELVKAARAQAGAMPGSERAAVESEIDMTIDEALAEAQAASDLRTWAAEAPAEGELPPGAQGSIRLLMYTDAEGRGVVLGVDEQDVLRFRSYAPVAGDVVSDDPLPPDAPARN